LRFERKMEKVYELEVSVISCDEGLIHAHFEGILQLLARLPPGDRNLTISQRSSKLKDEPLG